MQCQELFLYRFESFWQMYPEYKWKWCYFAFGLYFAMYFLNLFWFSNILWTLLEVSGLTKAMEMTEREKQVDMSDDDSSTEDEIEKKDK